MTAAIVLAGGASSRFGDDKLAAVLDGRPLLEHALLAVAEVADPIVVVRSSDTAARGLPRGLAARMIVARDATPYGGPLAGLATGLRALADTGATDDAGGPALVVGGDMPRLVPAVLQLLVATLSADPARRACALEADPPATLPLAVRPGAALEAAYQLLAGDRRSLVALLERLGATTIPGRAWRPLDPDGRTLVDVDTPADLAGA